MTTPFATRNDMLDALAPLASPGGAHDILSSETETIVKNIFEIVSILPTPVETQNRLIGHFGLRGELWNGSGMIFHRCLKSTFNNNAAPESLIVMGIEEYAQSFLRKPSQLAKITQEGMTQETSGEALERCYNEISQWVEAVVPEQAYMLEDFNRILVTDSAQKIKHSLANMNEARLALKSFAERASAHLNLKDNPYQEMDRTRHSQFHQLIYA